MKSDSAASTVPTRASRIRTQFSIGPKLCQMICQPGTFGLACSRTSKDILARSIRSPRDNMRWASKNAHGTHRRPATDQSVNHG